MRKLHRGCEGPWSVPATRASSLPAQWLRALALATFLTTPATIAKTIYVNANQTNSAPDGLTWATAFNTVQSSAAAASPGDEIWVAASAYFENITLRHDVAIYGGFRGVETNLNQRNWTTNVTILDGNQTNSVIVVEPGAGNATRIDGFLIRNGRAINGDRKSVV